jgi:hypothetical protein
MPMPSLEYLALSPQCGFVSVAAGNLLSCTAGCKFSRVPTLLTLAIVEAKSGSQV